MSMLVRMVAMALTWSDLERSKLRTRIFQRAVTWKRLQIGVTWRNLVLGQRPLGMGSTVPLGTVPLVVIVIAAIVVRQW